VISDVTGPSSITSPIAPKPRRVNDISGFTIDKLQYASLGFHGREPELKLMTDRLAEVMSDDESPEHQERHLILISGYSGTGKTALANHALQKSTEKLGGLFALGKFDWNARDQPYSGIRAACAGICAAILALRLRQPRRADDLGHQITTDLGTELALLIQVIPVLAEVVHFDHDVSSSSSIIDSSSMIAMSSSAEAKNKINFAFLRFIRAVSCQFIPLVLVFDDLQWADGASLDLLEALLMDATSTSKLLVVGIYRSNEVNQSHIFHHTRQYLERKSREKYFEMTPIEIGNLSVDAVHRIIQELLAMDTKSDLSRTRSLADVCHRKTQGNAFFVLQFVAMLKEQKLLQFNFGILSWTWEEKEIEASTRASDNVVDYLKTKMSQLSDDLVDLLKLASCLGSTFEMPTLNVVWDRSNPGRTVECNRDTLMANVGTLEAEGYIVKNESKSTYSWSHDKIQEAALSLVPDTKQGEFAAKVGQILLSHLEEKELDSALFVVVDLLNGRMTGSQDSRLALAKLNCRASQKAILCSAFDSAAGYAAKGIQLLPENAWADHYELALTLRSLGAKAEGVLGNTETMERYCKQVLSQEDRPIEDKFKVYNTWIDSVVNRVIYDDARDLSLEILRKFKCQFPSNPALVGFGVLKNIVKIKRTMKSRDVSKLNTMRDATKIELMQILDKLGTIFYMLKDKRLPLVIFKSLNWTIKYGHCDYSSVGWATVGLILTGVLNDHQGGSQYGEEALTLMAMSKTRVTAARTMLIVYGMIFAFTKPLRSLLKPLLQGYDVGLQTG
jgi:predicted ATPase